MGVLNKKLFFASLIVIAILSFAFISATEESLGVFKQDTCIELKQICANCTYVNITSVLYPDSTIALSNVVMTKTDTEFNRTFCSANKTGQYIVNGFGDVDGVKTIFSYSFDVTGNGKTAPSGGVIALFSILFLIILLVFAYLIIYSIGHAMTLDFDIIDLAWNFGIYFAFIGTYMLGDLYLGEQAIMTFLNWVIYIGAFTNLFLPALYFILTLTIGSYMKRRVKGVDY